MSDTSTSPDTGITGAAAAFEGLIERSTATMMQSAAWISSSVSSLPTPPAPFVSTLMVRPRV